MHEKSVKLLNEALADELGAIHQYMYFHFHCDDQGYDPLAAMYKQTAIDEMMHAEQLAERILFLGGEVEMKVGTAVQKTHAVAEMLALTKSLEEQAVMMYNRFANECGQNADNVTKKLFEDLVLAEERHYDGFDTQEEHLKKFGEQFLALQSIERSKTLAGGPPTQA
jgi:bacterioferritin